MLTLCPNCLVANTNQATGVEERRGQKTSPGFALFMLKGSASIQMMKKGLGEALWREKEKLALPWLEETLPTLKRTLTSDALLGVK